MLFKQRSIRIEDLLDRKNKGLYEYVNQSLELSMKETEEPYYGIFTKGKCAELHIPKGKVSSPELLHAELKIKGGLFSTKLSVSERPLLVPIFSEALSDI